MGGIEISRDHPIISNPLKMFTLHIACVSNWLEVVKQHLTHKPDIDPIRPGRLTSLMIAADRGYLEIMEELLKHGAN